MARPSKDALGVAEQPAPEVIEPAAPRFALKKNHGLTILGKSHRHFTAGTEFDPIQDADLILRLIQSGALFE